MEHLIQLSNFKEYEYITKEGSAELHPINWTILVCFSLSTLGLKFPCPCFAQARDTDTFETNLLLAAFELI